MTTQTRNAAEQAWRSILELVGWSGKRPPRFPMVAAEFDLSPKQLGVLYKLAPGTTLPMRAIADHLFCDASYVTDMVDKLEERGLIERGAAPDDRRVKLIALTRKGEKFRERLMDRLFEAPAELGALSPGEQRQLATLLAKAAAAGS
jgi:DNA-binding MarR family transcriptional regulator